MTSQPGQDRNIRSISQGPDGKTYIGDDGNNGAKSSTSG